MYFKIVEKEIVEKFNDISKRIEEKRKRLIAIADSYNAELFTYSTGFREYCQFAGLKFKKNAPSGFCKPDCNGMQKPYQRNKEFLDKINCLPSVKKQEAMDLLNFPANGIHKETFTFGESNFLTSIAWEVSKDKKCVIFKFPDKYSIHSSPKWIPPKYAIEILSSEYNQVLGEIYHE
ncbi:MAG: hypothetical protein PHV82_14050 [Victivallaceae bacterium]|nr:hypothetical protein [Victivallaceae bacterium]